MRNEFLNALISKYPNSLELGQAVQHWVHFKKDKINIGITDESEIERIFLEKNFQFRP